MRYFRRDNLRYGNDNEVYFMIEHCNIGIDLKKFVERYFS